MTDLCNVPAGALPPAILDLQRGLLRDVIRRSATFHDTDEVPRKLDETSKPKSTETARDTDANGGGADPERPSLRGILVHRQFHQPLAADLTPDEIAARIIQGDDPWAAAFDASGPVEAVPIQALLVGCGLVRLFGGEMQLAQLLAPGAITLIPAPSSEQAALHAVLEDFVPAFLKRACRSDNATELAVLALDAGVQAEPGNAWSNRKLDAAHQRLAFDAMIARNAPMLVLASGKDALPETARRLPVRSTPWPALETDDVIEILRATHSHTGCLAEEAIRAALPTPERLSSLDPLLWQRALTEASPIHAARRLAEICVGGPGSSGPTLANLHGQADVRKELEALVGDVGAWRAGQLDWTEVTSSVLFTGPPGVGKTMAAQALAGSANAHFVSTSYGACQAAGHLGDYLKAMKARVDEAIENAPSVFFLDEVDSFPRRDGEDRQGSRYGANVVNAMLTELTRLAAIPGVIVIGATNHPERVDPAITRSGRFDLHLEMGLPDRSGVTAILRCHLGNDATRIEEGPIADQLLGCTGADVASVVRMARGLARRRGARLSEEDLQMAAGRIAPEQSAESLWEIAVHEAGHIVVAAALGLAPPRGAKITARGGEVEVPRPDRMTRDVLDRRIATVLAGRAAEELILGNTSHWAGYGEGSDLEVATELAFKIETEWAMGDHLIHTAIQSRDRLRLPEGLRRRIERHLATAHRRAADVLALHEDALVGIARRLQAERELDAERIADLTEGIRRAGEDQASRGPLRVVH